MEILDISLQSPDLTFLLATTGPEDVQFATALGKKTGRTKEDT
jgi:hypothetical protein